jgi:hypothetical protein
VAIATKHVSMYRYIVWLSILCQNLAELQVLSEKSNLADPVNTLFMTESTQYFVKIALKPSQFLDCRHKFSSLLKFYYILNIYCYFLFYRFFENDEKYDLKNYFNFLLQERNSRYLIVIVTGNKIFWFCNEKHGHNYP